MPYFQLFFNDSLTGAHCSYYTGIVQLGRYEADSNALYFVRLGQVKDTVLAKSLIL